VQLQHKKMVRFKNQTFLRHGSVWAGYNLHHNTDVWRSWYMCSKVSISTFRLTCI